MVIFRENIKQMSPAFSPLPLTSISLQCTVPLIAKCNVDGYLQSPTCGFLPIFTKAIPIQRNRLTKVSSWSSSKLYGSNCGEIHIPKVVFVDCWGVLHARSMASSRSGIFAAEDFANGSQISPRDSLHRGCEVQCEPWKFLVFLHAGANILLFLDKWKVYMSDLLNNLLQGFGLKSDCT